MARLIEDCVRIVALRHGKIAETRDPSRLKDLLDDGETRLWIDLTEPTPSIVELIGGRLGLHPLIAEDIIESNERAKVELVEDVIHVVMFALSRDAETQIHEIDFVLGQKYLLSVHGREWNPTSVHQLKVGAGPALARGPDYLLYALVDGIVDAYFPVFDRFADEIDQLQDEILENAVPATLRRLFGLKRELIKIRHVIGPSREIFNRLTAREFPLVADANVFYFRDVYDHLIRLTDEFDSFRELVTGALDVYLSTVNNNLSVIVKRLTGVTVIVAGIGAVGGLFGMSQATPALAGQEGFGFWAILIGTLVVSAVGVAFLRRIDWI